MTAAVRELNVKRGERREEREERGEGTGESRGERERRNDNIDIYIRITDY